MILVEKHIIKKNNPDWKKIDHAAYIGKNVYNQAVYFLRNHYEETGKHMGFYSLDKAFRADPELRENYDTLPNNTSQQILKLVDQNYKSFFALVKKWNKDKKILENAPKPPKYKDKEKGRCVLPFTNAQIKVKDGYITFPKKIGIRPIKTKVKKLQFARIVPQSSCYVIEIGYKVEPKEIKDGELKRVASIDLGVSNLCSMITNDPGLKPLIVNGKPLKSINQYYNKKIVPIKSQLKKNHNKHWSHQLNNITLKRNNKIKDYMHKTSRLIINYCIEHDIDTIIVGENKDWKRDINIGRKNNQHFVSIPHSMLIDQLKYKAELEGIKFLIIEESYTSKIDHFAFEEMKHQELYLGKRIKRGLFKSSTGKIINADINGAIGIKRKVIGDDFINLLDIGCVAQPVKVNPLLNYSMRSAG